MSIYFTLVILIILSIECICKVILLAKGIPNKPTLASMAGDVILQFILLIWGVIVLSKY